MNGPKEKPACHPQVLSALRAELHQHAGGHQAEVQADVAKLGTVAARTIYHALSQTRSTNNSMRAAQPWRKF
jgi:hypothetical protein